MRIAARTYRQVVVTVLILSAGGAVAGPAGSASAVTASGKPGSALPVTGRAATAAVTQSAPVVTDAQPTAPSKRGLPAPPMTAAMRWANARRQASARALLLLQAAALSRDAKCASLACRAGLPSAKNLAATQEPQARDYFCGPATVSEMLAQLGVKLGQFAAARELRTTANGTDWSDATGYPVPKVLNGNQTRNRYVAVALPWTPTAKQITTYETDLVADIADKGGVPLAGNAYEVAGGPHLVGNPVDQTIMHWFDIRGYQEYGAITDYEDSVHDASSIGWALDVPAYSSMPSSTIADILGARGYDW